MARTPSPWWWDAEEGWYVNLQGKRHFLGQHPEGAATPKKSKKTGRWNVPKDIDAAFRRLLGGETQSTAGVPNAAYLSTYLQAFLNFSRENRAKETHDRYFRFLDDFERHWHGLTIDKLNPDHVTKWLAEKETWNSTTKFNATTALQAALNWCVQNTDLKVNPIRGMKKHKPRTRTDTVTPEEFEKLLQHALPEFRDLLVASYDSGARPFEIKDLEARHVQADLQRAIIPADEAKGRKHTRVIYFPTKRSMEVITRLCEKRPEGPLFRNSKGNKWTAMAVKCAFARMDNVLGRRVTQYSLRHSFITGKIVAGVDSHVVATLSGHRSTEMIDRVYSSVAKDHEFLLAEARKGITSEDA